MRVCLRFDVQVRDVCPTRCAAKHEAASKRGAAREVELEAATSTHAASTPTAPRAPVAAPAAKATAAKPAPEKALPAKATAATAATAAARATAAPAAAAAAAAASPVTTAAPVAAAPFAVAVAEPVGPTDLYSNCAEMKEAHGCDQCCLGDGKSVAEACPATCAQ